MSTVPSLFDLKGQARNLQLQTSCKLHLAQQMIATSNGFRNWQTLSAALSKKPSDKFQSIKDEYSIPNSLLEYVDDLEKRNKTWEFEKNLFSNSLFIALDIKEAMDFDKRDDFVSNYDKSHNFCYRPLLIKEWNSYVSGEHDFEDEIVSESDKKAFLADKLKNFDPIEFLNDFNDYTVGEYTIFRYKKSEPGMTFEQAYGLAIDRCFWHPVYMWLNGVFIDISQIPEIKVNGQVVSRHHTGG
jgi:hypothetical protein